MAASAERNSTLLRPSNRLRRVTRLRKATRERLWVFAVVAFALLPIMQVATAGEAAASPTLQSTGSSFAGVAMQQWVAQAATLYGLNINWEVQSSVVGLNYFAQDQVDFGASDIPYSSGQADSTPTVPFEYMPDVAGALAFMYNLTGTDGSPITNLVLDAQTIFEIFSGKITSWDSPDIAALNPQLQGDLPNTKILAVTRADPSGENYLLSDYLLHMVGGEFSNFQGAVGWEPGQSPQDSQGEPSASWPQPTNGQDVPGYPGWQDGNMIGQAGSDNAADYVAAAASNGAITYVETAYAKEHNSPVASIVNASGNAVQPTSFNDATALERAVLHADLTQDLTGVYTNPLPNAYPISAYSYIVSPCSPQLAAAQSPPTACAGNNGGTSPFPSDKGQALGQFVSFLACAGQEKMALLGYSPLPPNLVQEDFDAVGRLNGGQEPPPPTPATCQNPYVDGEIPLPGEPAIYGQAAGTPGSSPGFDAGGAGGSGSGGASGPGGSGPGGSYANGYGPGGAGSGPGGAYGGAGGAAGAAAYLAKLKHHPALSSFNRADSLEHAANDALGFIPVSTQILIWCLALALALAAPLVVPALLRRRRNARPAVANAGGGPGSDHPPGSDAAPPPAPAMTDGKGASSNVFKRAGRIFKRSGS
ncbi:MAG TPA: substrate-binding domain-containing protein [Acidimicrobiales bacterium]|nr:substrate-binding domain-containing protein [Acidimicrobiales bacterium]